MSKSSPPDVTIVTPSYQQSPFIEETIQSVLAQTGVKIEYLVMDGGSTDGTLEILEKYGSRLQYLSEKDQGQTDAINNSCVATWIGSISTAAATSKPADSKPRLRLPAPANRSIPIGRMISFFLLVNSQVLV